MKVGLRVFAGVLAAAFFFLSIVIFRRAPDPVFEGRLASEWVNDLLSSDYQTRAGAQLALQAFGEPAVPQLRRLLHKQNGPWEKHLVKLNRWVPFLNYRISDAVLCRQRAAEMVGLLRGRARAAIPDLVSSLALEPCAPDAERALLRCGKLALPTLEQALAHREPAVRRRAAKLLGEIGRIPSSAAFALLRLSRDRDAAVRAEVGRTLGQIHSALPSGEIVGTLVRLAADPASAVRAAALQALGQRESSPASVAAARRGLADPAILVRLHAAKTIWQLEKDDDAILPVLIAILPTRESWQAAYALADLGELAAPAVPSLVAALHRERVPRPFRTPPSCAFALGQIGAAAIPALAEMLKDPDSRARLNAVLAIGFMGAGGQPAVPELLPLLEDRDAEVRHAAALTLAAIGAEPSQVLAGLSACLGAEDIYMRSAAAQILREIAPHENWVVPSE